MNKKIVALSIITTSLLASSYDIGSIEVTSPSKSPQSIQDITSNIQVITQEELEEKNYTTIAEALNSLSGINYTSNGGLGNTTSILVRGMDNKRVLVLIDGINYKDPSSTSGTSFGHLMINDIERIEVVKGAQSSVWGNDATAGVINIITKKAQKGLHSSINIEKGSFNTNIVKANISNKTTLLYLFKILLYKTKR
jgi:vitamin B12 transporter